MTHTTPGEAMPENVVEASRAFITLPCSCGCGKEITSPNRWGRPTRYARGHNRYTPKRAVVGYVQAHIRVNNLRGHPHCCEECGITEPQRHYEWASISGDYNDPNDYRRLCKPCHMKFDEVGPKISRDKTGRPRPDMQGEAHHQAKLSKHDVIDIRHRIGNGESLLFVARKFGVSHTHIWRIVHHISWKHVV